jgi:hypothetical protein
MSAIAQFKLDFSEWEWRMVFLEDCPYSEVEELRQAIRDDWADIEKRNNWIVTVTKEAKFSRELKQMGRDVTTRIKAQLAKDRFDSWMANPNDYPMMPNV